MTTVRPDAPGRTAPVRRRRAVWVLAGAGVALVVCVLAGVGVGAFPLAPGPVLATLADRAVRPLGGSVGGGLDPTGTAVLLHRIGWTVQVPARRAAERDEDKIARWREDTWPVIKGRRRTWAPGSAGKTSPARG